MSRDQAAELLAEIRRIFTPLTRLYAPLLVGHVDLQTHAKLKSYEKEPAPIWLLQSGVWHTLVRDLGYLGTLSDMELGGFVDPFEATRNLLKSLRSNVEGLLDFLDTTEQQPNAARILERCLKDSVARTVWMTQQKPGQEFPSEAKVDEILRISGGGNRAD